MKPSVWIVDDNAAVRESVALLLQTEGMDTQTFSLTNPVLESLENYPTPSILLLDLVVPGNGGEWLVARITANPEWTFPIVVMTGFAERLAHCVTGRVVKVFEKPINPRELVDYLRSILTPNGTRGDSLPPI